MARYRIVCTEQEPVNRDPHHAHIVAVGVGADASRAQQRMTLQEVLTAMKLGHTFYTQGAHSGRVAEVKSERCPQCVHHITIRSTADAVQDNNLDNLRTCAWAA